MNILSTLERLAAGPLFVPTLYGDYLGFPLGFMLFSNTNYNPWMVAAIVIALYPFLNYYHLATGALVKNAIMEEASPKMMNTIKQIAEHEQITVANIAEVSNFTSPTLLMGRFKNNVEVYFSSHWNHELPEKALTVMLHDSFKDIKEKTYRLFISSSLFAAQNLTQTAFFVILRSMCGFTTTSFLLTLFFWQLCTWYILFLKAYLLRQLTFSRDLQIAKQLGTQTVIEGFQQFNMCTNFDENLATIPEWALGVPKISSRIEALSQHESTKTS